MCLFKELIAVRHLQTVNSLREFKLADFEQQNQKQLFCFQGQQILKIDRMKSSLFPNLSYVRDVPQY